MLHPKPFITVLILFDRVIGVPFAKMTAVPCLL